MEHGSRLIAQADGVNFLEFQEAIYGADNVQGSSWWSKFIQIFQEAIDAHFIDSFSTPGGIISRFLPFILSAAGLILFVMLIWGGFEFMMGASNPKSAESGKQRITSAFIGFFILFSVFWIAQIMQTIFGINIGIQ